MSMEIAVCVVDVRPGHPDPRDEIVLRILDGFVRRLKYVPRIVAWDPMAEFSKLLPDTFESLDALDKYLREASRVETLAWALSS